jgi:hypothetical protein
MIFPPCRFLDRVSPIREVYRMMRGWEEVRGKSVTASA